MMLIYEDLKENPLKMTVEIRKWLQKVYPGKILDREECLNDLEGDFHRKSKNVDYSWITDKLLTHGDLLVLDKLQAELLNDSRVIYPKSYTFY